MTDRSGLTVIESCGESKIRVRESPRLSVIEPDSIETCLDEGQVTEVTGNASFVYDNTNGGSLIIVALHSKPHDELQVSYLRDIHHYDSRALSSTLADILMGFEKAAENYSKIPFPSGKIISFDYSQEAYDALSEREKEAVGTNMRIIRREISDAQNRISPFLVFDGQELEMGRYVITLNPSAYVFIDVQESGSLELVKP